jgi:hypothetical protein
MRSILKYSFVSVLLILIVALSARAQTKQFVGMNVSKIDESNHRIFVAPSTAFLTTLKTTKEYLARLSADISRQYPEWGSKWEVSFFSEPRYATYKDDEQVEQAVHDGTWSNAYLAEYDNSTKIIVTAPMDPVKIKSARIE